jgi:hypothetical protein
MNDHARVLLLYSRKYAYYSVLKAGAEEKVAYFKKKVGLPDDDRYIYQDTDSLFVTGYSSDATPFQPILNEEGNLNYFEYMSLLFKYQDEVLSAKIYLEVWLQVSRLLTYAVYACPTRNIYPQGQVLSKLPDNYIKEMRDRLHRGKELHNAITEGFSHIYTCQVNFDQVNGIVAKS